MHSSTPCGACLHHVTCRIGPELAHVGIIPMHHRNGTSMHVHPYGPCQKRYGVACLRERGLARARACMVRCRRSMAEAVARVCIARSCCAGEKVGTTAAAPSGVGSSSVTAPLRATRLHRSTCAQAHAFSVQSCFTAAGWAL